MIELKDITVCYGPKRVVDNVSTRAASGEFIALVGPNGSGKSSLLKAIVGLIPSTGENTLPPVGRERAKKISYLAQNCTAPDQRLVSDVIALGRTPFLGSFSKLSPEDRSAIQRASDFCEIEDLLDRQFGTLSGGEKMRVHLSRTLATQADILIADEPTTALDPYYQISAMNILRKTANDGVTVIAALHNLDYAKRYSDRIWVMKDGQLVADDIPKKALSPQIIRDVFRVSPDGQIIG